MKSLLFKIYRLIKINQADIILVIGVILISLLSFAVGYITAKQKEKEPLIFETLESQLPNSGESLNFK